MNSEPGTRARTACGSVPPATGSDPPDPVASRPGRRPGTCPRALPCPPADAPGRQAARVISCHPEQGWSLLCNGVLIFEDTGALLPDGSIIEPPSLAGQPVSTGTPQAGHARTITPAPDGRSCGRGLRRPASPPWPAQPSTTMAAGHGGGGFPDDATQDQPLAAAQGTTARSAPVAGSRASRGHDATLARSSRYGG